MARSSKRAAEQAEPAGAGGRPWWLIVPAVVAVVAVGSILLDNWARGQIGNQAASSIRQLLQLEDEHPVRLEVDGFSALAQLLGGRLEGVRAEVDEVAVGELRGTVAIDARGIPVDAQNPAASFERPVERVELRIAVDEASVEAIAESMTASAVQEVELVDDRIQLSGSWRILVVDLSIGLGVRPFVQEGRLGFEPVDLTVNGATTTVEALRQQFGAIADLVFQPREICVASALPSALVLQSAAVEEERLAMVITAEQALFDEAALAERGSCAD